MDFEVQIQNPYKKRDLIFVNEDTSFMVLRYYRKLNTLQPSTTLYSATKVSLHDNDVFTRTYAKRVCIVHTRRGSYVCVGCSSRYLYRVDWRYAYRMRSREDESTCV